jgi:hypothetical protein
MAVVLWIIRGVVKYSQRVMRFLASLSVVGVV